MIIHATLVPDNGKTLTEACEPLVDNLGTQSFGKGLLALGALKVAGAMSDRTFSALLDKLKPKINSFIRDLLIKKAIFADAKVESVVKEGNTMHLTLDVTDVDYPALADRYLPRLMESERRRAPDGLLPSVFDALGGEQSPAVRAFLDTLSEETKERIAALILADRKQALCQKVSLALKKRNLDLSLADMEII